MTPPLARQKLVPVTVAVDLLLRRLRAVAVERVPLAEAVGRVLAEDVRALWKLPGCDNSAMDGYAVRAVDCARASSTTPVLLGIDGEVRAGSPPGRLRPGTAMAISTGAPIPAGADAVVPVEDTQPGQGTVTISATVAAGSCIRRAGEDVSPGTVMVPAGRRLRGIDLAACAAVGAARPLVHRRPRVAVLSSGDELVPLGVAPAPHQVVDSNAVMLAAAVAAAGAQPVPFAVMADERGVVEKQLAEAAAGTDLVITTAGVSVGTHDHIRATVEELGEVLVWRVAMRPGKPVLIGEIEGTCVLGLPGNPVSSAVAFEVFGRPAILALQGAAEPLRRRIAVRLGQAVSTPRDLHTYLRVRLQPGSDAIPVATLSGGQGSSMLRALGDADALVEVPAGVEDVAAGELLSALDLA